MVETTRKEKLAWISYDWANSVFASIGLVFAIPLLLDYWAFGAGSAMDLQASGTDWYKPGSCIKGDPLADPASPMHSDNCVVPWFGDFIRHTTWTLNIISLSVALQAFLFISLGSLADVSNFRKRFLVFFTVCGAICTSLLAVVDSSTLWLGALLTILANACFGCSVVFYTAYLPLLARNDPLVIEKPELLETVSNRLSTHGFAFGYLSGMLMAAVSAVLYIYYGTSTGFKISLLLVGFWWLLFSIPTLLFLKTRPGPEISSSYLFYSWKQLFQLLKSAKRLPMLLLYLGCYFIFSDGYNTIASVAILFAQNELKVDEITIGSLVVTTPLAAFAGNYLFFGIQKWLNLRTKTMVISCLCCYVVLCCYGILGIFESSPVGFKPWNVLVLNEKCVESKLNGRSVYSGTGCRTLPWELYLFSVLHGMLLGSIQSFSRVVFSELIPIGHESEFFSLYEISDRGSSFIGPLVVAALNQGSGTLRLSFVYFCASFLLPIILLMFCNIERGKQQASEFITKSAAFTDSANVTHINDGISSKIKAEL